MSSAGGRGGRSTLAPAENLAYSPQASTSCLIARGASNDDCTRHQQRWRLEARQRRQLRGHRLRSALEYILGRKGGNMLAELLSYPQKLIPLALRRCLVARLRRERDLERRLVAQCRKQRARRDDARDVVGARCGAGTHASMYGTVALSVAVAWVRGRARARSAEVRVEERCAALRASMASPARTDTPSVCLS